MDNRGPQLEAVVGFFLALSWITVGLRCWVRIKLVKAFAIDDWFCLITLVSHSASSEYSTFHGGFYIHVSSDVHRKRPV